MTVVFLYGAVEVYIQKWRLGPGAEIQTLAVKTRTAVWVSTAEEIVLRKTRKFPRNLEDRNCLKQGMQAHLAIFRSEFST